MSKIFEEGYEDAKCYDWDKFTDDHAFKIIARYKIHAAENSNEYMSGLAQGAEDVVMKRVAA